MMMDDRRLRKVALYSGVVAGIAYLSYSVLKTAFCGRGWWSERNKIPSHQSNLKSTSCQTDITSLSTTRPCMLPGTTVQEGIRELNLKAQEYRELGLNFSQRDKTKSLQNSPWSSPWSLSPADEKRIMSRSVDNLTLCVRTNSPLHRRKSMPKERVSLDGEETLLIKQTDCHLPTLKESEQVLYKQLDSLSVKARIMTCYEAKCLVTLLHSKDEETQVKMLTTMSNCAAFTVNQNRLADAGCLVVLRNLIKSPSPVVQVTAVQAVANLAVNSRNQAPFQVCVPVLMNYAVDPETGAYLRSLSLMALANLALEEVPVTLYRSNLHSLFQFLEGSTVKIQVLKLLNNLSCCSSIAPYILTTKCPSVCKMLNNENRDVILRLLTFLGNMSMAAGQQKLLNKELSADDEKTSEMLESTVFSQLLSESFYRKIFSLSSSSDEEVCANARKVYSILSQLHQYNI
ncbi:armadillo repeat-containing X-linked protein 1-like [Limulus polyphemus]|uniref:Armadillo repeat-containing X-linked protein 1-like n=1 Tax=Limulus polyphemus TaxID=6850 RepID=A0ABM1TEE4_LIMPO|nr:armadillo repeat-containing X-linked protein 1-like [Limulus polyphemus]